jgi:hypothetical protein
LTKRIIESAKLALDDLTESRIGHFQHELAEIFAFE